MCHTNPVSVQDNDTAAWTFLTLASLGKQVGQLGERYRHDPAMSAQVRQVECELEEVLLGEIGSGLTIRLLELSGRLAALKGN